MRKTLEGPGLGNQVLFTDFAHLDGYLSGHPSVTLSGFSMSAPSSAVRRAAKPAAEKRDPAPRAAEKDVQPQAGVASAFNGNRRVPPPVNEPVKQYAPESAERVSLKER